MKTMTIPLRGGRLRALTAFNPALPVDGSLVEAGELRDQFNGLAALIAAIPSVDAAVVERKHRRAAAAIADARLAKFRFCKTMRSSGALGPVHDSPAQKQSAPHELCRRTRTAVP